MVLAKKIMKYR